MLSWFLTRVLFLLAVLIATIGYLMVAMFVRSRIRHTTFKYEMDHALDEEEE